MIDKDLLKQKYIEKTGRDEDNWSALEVDLFETIGQIMDESKDITIGEVEEAYNAGIDAGRMQEAGLESILPFDSWWFYHRKLKNNG